MQTLKKPNMSLTLKMTDNNNVGQVVDLINHEYERTGSVLPVEISEVRKWISGQNSAVAIDSFGRVVAHQAAYHWQDCEMFELRSAVVEPEFRGNGINFWMKKFVIEEIAKRVREPTTFISLKNDASSGTGILMALGFKQVPRTEVPDKILDFGGNQEWKAYKLLIKECMR